MSDRQQLLDRLAATIAAHGLATPARLALDVAAPLSLLGSQLVLFLRPLLPNPWQPYAALLRDEAAWAELRQRLDARDY